jgi:hypothetical protein
LVITAAQSMGYTDEILVMRSLVIRRTTTWT